MTEGLSRSALLLSLVAPIFLSACANDSGVSQAEYDSLAAQKSAASEPE